MAKPWDRGARGWYVRFTRDGKRRARRVGPPGPEGERKAREISAALDRAAERDQLWDLGPSQPLPLDELVRAWRTRHADLRSQRTQITDHGLVERLARHFGGTDVRDLTDESVREFASAVVREGRSGHVAANALSLLRRVVNLAVKSGLIDRNPVLEWGVVMRQARARTAQETASRDAWSREEAAAMLELAAQHERHLAPILLAALHTGARRGELLALRWEDVDLAQRRIHFRRTVEAGKGHRTKLPKSGRGRLTPISEALAAALVAHRKAQRRGRLRGCMDAATLVFRSPRGKPWGERNLARAWERLRADHFTKAGVRMLPWHCTRHTFISWALGAGTPAKVVADWTGVSVSVIERHYAHAIPATWSVAFLDAWNQMEPGRNHESRKVVTRLGFEPKTPSFGE